MARRFQQNTPFRRYTGDNPIFTFTPSSFDPIETEREKGYRTGQNIQGVMDSVSGIIEQNQKNKQELFKKIPYGKTYKSDKITEEAEKRMKAIDSDAKKRLKDKFGVLTYKDRLDLENQIAGFEAWDKEKQAQEKELGEAFNVVLDNSKNKNIDVDASKARLEALEENIIEGWQSPKGLIVPKPVDYEPLLSKSIDAFTQGERMIEVETEENGQEVTKSVKSDLVFTKLDGTLNDVEVKKFIKSQLNANPNMHYAVARHLIDNDPKYKGLKDAWLRNEIDLSEVVQHPDIKDTFEQEMVDKVFQDKKGMFERSVYKKSTQNIDESDIDYQSKQGRGTYSKEVSVLSTNDVDISIGENASLGKIRAKKQDKLKKGGKYMDINHADYDGMIMLSALGSDEKIDVENLKKIEVDGVVEIEEKELNRIFDMVYGKYSTKDGVTNPKTFYQSKTKPNKWIMGTTEVEVKVDGETKKKTRTVLIPYNQNNASELKQITAPDSNPDQGYYWEDEKKKETKQQESEEDTEDPMGVLDLIK